MPIDPSFKGFCMPLRGASSSEARRQIKMSKKPVVVKFHSPGCPSCLEAAPEIQSAACPFRDDVEFLEVDVERDSELADELKVKSIPFVAAFKGGQLVSKKIGGSDSGSYSRWLKKIMGDD